jgi:hypothetical protein
MGLRHIPPGSSIQCAYQHTHPQTLAEGQHIHQYAAPVARSCVEHHPSATCMTEVANDAKTSDVKLSEGAVQRFISWEFRSGAALASAGAGQQRVRLRGKNLKYPSVGQVTDAYEANEISFRYEDKTAVGLHKSAAPPVVGLVSPGRCCCGTMSSSIGSCHAIGQVSISLSGAVDSETSLTTLVTVVRPGDPR